MNDYISLTELWGEPFDYIIDTCGSAVAQGFVDRVNKIPTSDVVGAVRCRECDNWEPGWIDDNDSFCAPMCVLHARPSHPDYYCSDAKRKDADND